jgi:hypothetical protein
MYHRHRALLSGRSWLSHGSALGAAAGPLVRPLTRIRHQCAAPSLIAAPSLHPHTRPPPASRSVLHSVQYAQPGLNPRPSRRRPCSCQSKYLYGQAETPGRAFKRGSITRPGWTWRRAPNITQTHKKLAGIYIPTQQTWLPINTWQKDSQGKQTTVCIQSNMWRNFQRARNASMRLFHRKSCVAPFSYCTTAVCAAAASRWASLRLVTRCAPAQLDSPAPGPRGGSPSPWLC